MPSAKQQLLFLFFAIACALGQATPVAADAGNVIAGLLGACQSHAQHSDVTTCAAQREATSDWSSRRRMAHECTIELVRKSNATTRVATAASSPLSPRSLTAAGRVRVRLCICSVLALIVICAFLGWWSRRGDNSRSSGSEGETA